MKDKTTMADYDYDDRWACQYCREEREFQNKPPRDADKRHSFGCYAGKMCDDCWKTSGYRDATDSTAEFSPLDAGERIDDDY